MRIEHTRTEKIGRWAFRALLLCLAATAAPAWTQQPQSSPTPTPPTAAAPASPGPSAGQAKPPSSKAGQSDKSATQITPEQAKQLFALVDELIKFAAGDTGLPVKSVVKRQLTTRAAVESYLDEKFNEDEGAKRLERDEIVLKKFGLLDRDFELKPFLLALLKEQIEAYYDSKTKTVNLLDWVDPDEQKPVMAHELTHALVHIHLGLDLYEVDTLLECAHFPGKRHWPKKSGREAQ